MKIENGIQTLSYCRIKNELKFKKLNKHKKKYILEYHVNAEAKLVLIKFNALLNKLGKLHATCLKVKYILLDLNSKLL